MKKLIVTLILGLITVVSFSSCGNSKKDAENLIVGDWILVGDNMGHHLMDDESAHIFFNADGTWKTVYTLGDVTKNHKGKYYIVNENTIAMARNGEHQQDFHNICCKETHKSSACGRNCNKPFIWLNIIFNSHIANIGFFFGKIKNICKKNR